jgi:hypothetical protein
MTKARKDMAESSSHELALANRAHGKLIEGVHIATYSFERACANLEWLLDDDRWRECGEGYDDINKFLASVQLDSFRIVAEQRKRIANRIKELQPEASNRTIAKALGVGHQTIGRDIGPNGPIDPENINENNNADAGTGPNVPPAELSGAQAAEAVASAAAAPESTIRYYGASPHAERGLDLYETPPVATRALLDVEKLSGTIWEPACGPGSIVRVLREAGHHVIATDLKDYGCAEAFGGIDFLAQSSAPEGAETVLTNSPFMHADEFVRHALTLVPRVLMLLRLGFLESQGRSDILDGGQLARVFVFRTRLPMMHRDGWDGPKIDSSAIPFAWFVWDRDHHGRTSLQRISCDASDETQPPEMAARPVAGAASPISHQAQSFDMPDLPAALRRTPQ